MQRRILCYADLLKDKKAPRGYQLLRWMNFGAHVNRWMKFFPFLSSSGSHVCRPNGYDLMDNLKFDLIGLHVDGMLGHGLISLMRAGSI